MTEVEGRKMEARGFETVWKGLDWDLHVGWGMMALDGSELGWAAMD